MSVIRPDNRKRKREREDDDLGPVLNTVKPDPCSPPPVKMRKIVDLNPKEMFFIPPPPTPREQYPRRGHKRKQDDFWCIESLRRRVDPPKKRHRPDVPTVPDWVDHFLRERFENLCISAPIARKVFGTEEWEFFYKSPLPFEVTVFLFSIFGEQSFPVLPMVKKPPVYRSSWFRNLRYNPLRGRRLLRKWRKRRERPIPVITEWTRLVVEHYYGIRPDASLPDYITDRLCQ